MTNSVSVREEVSAAALSKIALENQKLGNPESEWGITGDGDGNIQGFATHISRNIGETVDFKIATDALHYRLDIYRLGYYAGLGARKVASIDKLLTSPQVQPHPVVDMTIGLIDCGNWSVSASWPIPLDAVTGVYFAKLVREDGTSGESIIPFIVREDGTESDIVFQTSDTTWQAYNAWGGASLYYGMVPVDPADMIGYMPPNCSCGLNAIGRAAAVSYNRPFITNTSPIGGTHDFIFGAESAAIQWLEQNGFDICYISGVDTTTNGALLLDHKVFLSIGHDEYWSSEQRSNVEAARDANVNLAFWSGNECYWKVRWEASIDGSAQPYRTMVCYKETWGTSVDPSGIGTGTWRDPRFADPGQEPENALTGTIFTVDSYRQDAISVPYDYSRLRFWRNTDVAGLSPGGTYQLQNNILGYEWDSDLENGFRPAGLVNLSLTTITVDTYLRDYGTSVGSGPATHSLTMYRAPSGALVFGAGTVFWSWGLSASHEGAVTPTDANVQQAMINMFADMGVQPTTIDPNLVPATGSSDETPPTSTITTTRNSFVEGEHVLITGTAQDQGGGIVAAVEVSTDGGQHWFKANGRETWSFNWAVQASGSYTLRSRAIDDSINMEQPSAGKQVTVSLPSTSSLWTLATVPAVETVLDRDSLEVGVRFQTTMAGLVRGIRFYKGFYNIGDHNVSLWSATGEQLATALSVAEPVSGWQTTMFENPVAIGSGTTYVASYHSGGYYSSNDGYFNSAYANGPLRVEQNGGVYAYGSASIFPTSSYNGANYWVDIVFEPSTANTPPLPHDDAGLQVQQGIMTPIPFSYVLANDTDPDGDALSIVAVSNAVHGAVTLNIPNQYFEFTPQTGYLGAASFDYMLSDGRGGTSTATVFLTVVPVLTATGLFTPANIPPSSGVNEQASVELGVKFTTSARGEIIGLRFYKSALDTGLHTGSLWSSTGEHLATVQFVNETASGWQTAFFLQAVNIQTGQTYVASYHSNGRYMATANFFAAGITNGPLTAPSSSTSGGNGVYAYGPASLFPTATYNSTNYWVDVLFQAPTQNDPPVAVPDSGILAIVNSSVTIAAATLLANDYDANNDALEIVSVENAVHGTVALDSLLNVIVFTADANYTGPASFRYTISDGHGGTASAEVSLTVASQGDVEHLFAPEASPVDLSVPDPMAVNLGMKFTTDISGWISGFRFYKSNTNVGPHTAYLWTSNGILLASAIFTNETASGWQSVNLPVDVPIKAGVTYIVSYSTNGHYSATGNFFVSAIDNGSIQAPASDLSGGNGVFAYGTSGLFPTNSFNRTNYYVDIAFRPQLLTEE